MLDDGTILVGTVSWYMHAFNLQLRWYAWCLLLSSLLLFVVSCVNFCYVVVLLLFGTFSLFCLFPSVVDLLMLILLLLFVIDFARMSVVFVLDCATFKIMSRTTNSQCRGFLVYSRRNNPLEILHTSLVETLSGKLDIFVLSRPVVTCSHMFITFW